MIHIITPKNKDIMCGQTNYIEFVWKLFNVASNYLYQSGDQHEVERVIHEVEECETINNTMFKSKFNGVPLKLSLLSTGSQVILCIYYLIKTEQTAGKMIDITDCGSNAIKYILKYYNEYDLTLYLGHSDLYQDMECEYKLNNEIVYNLYAICGVKNEKH